jgi:hypothetical protein
MITIRVGGTISRPAEIVGARNRESRDMRVNLLGKRLVRLGVTYVGVPLGRIRAPVA